MRKNRSSRRSFLRRSAGCLAVLGGGAHAASAAAVARALLRGREDRSAEELARDEDFWRPIQDAWHVDRSLLNLNNGGVSPPLASGLESCQRLADFAYQAPAYHMWRTLEPQKEAVRSSLARHFGADPEEIAIVRNASEALEVATFGLPLAAGDEVIATDQDYPRMVQAWRQRERREGIVFRQIELPMAPTGGRAEVVAAFRAALTERTRVLHFCHMVNLTGQILPVQELCSMARERGITTVVDGAHAFGHVPFHGSDLDCDFYGTSLHKWYSAPIGTGFLYVRRERIADTWPLFAAEPTLDADIRKFEQIGTHPVPLFLAIAEACRFHDVLGSERKEARMRFLRDYWAEPLRGEQSVRFHVSFDRAESCGLATVEILGADSQALAEHLLATQRIVVTAIRHPRFQGIRVSPHLYTTLPELQRFRDEMVRLARSGLPG